MLDTLNLTELSTATEIFMYVLENKSLTQDNNRELFDEYAKEKIQLMVKMIAEKADAEIKLINNTIYLIPNEENRFLGFSKTELKNTMLGSNATEQEYYLANFIILVLLTSFYNSTSGLSKSRNYIKYSDFENLITAKLSQADDYIDREELEANSGLAFNSIIDKWSSLKGSESKAQGKSSKTGFVLTVLRFLSNQGLVSYLTKEEIIVTSTKLDDLMNSILLSKSNFKKVEEILNRLRVDMNENSLSKELDKIENIDLAEGE